MAKIINDKYCYKCSNCNHPIFLPGIVPNEQMLFDNGWKYCPYCGEKIIFEQQPKQKMECYGLGHSQCDVCDMVCQYR